MQVAPLIIYPEYTREERLSIVVQLSHRVTAKKNVREAFDRLFGTQLPHIQIERLVRMNSRALVDTYNMRLFRILSSNPVEDFYMEDEYAEDYQLRYAHCWDDGNLIARWQKYTKNPNPHHILPESRGGTNNAKNFWFIDRATHNDFHTIFQNLTPSEQLIVLLILYKNIFSEDFTEAIGEVLYDSFREPTCYKGGVMRRDYREKGWMKI